MSAPDPVRVGVVGTGSFGRNHVRVLSDLPTAELTTVIDLDRELAAQVAAEFGTSACGSLDELIDQVDAAVVAVPTVSHADVGVRLLEAGLHVLVEKPMTPTLAEADRLLAAAGDRVLAVGHVEFYNPAVQALLARRPAAGYVEVQRLAPFTPRSLDIDVVLDLMIHDLQIFHALDPSPVREVRATGINVLSPRVDMANARVELESGCVANLTASRVSSERVRKLRVIPPNHYYSLDYEQQHIKGYRVEQLEGGPQIVREDLPVDRCEPLRREAEAFVAACRGEAGPLADGRMGRQALATAIAVSSAIGEGERGNV